MRATKHPLNNVVNHAANHDKTAMEHQTNSLCSANPCRVGRDTPFVSATCGASRSHPLRREKRDIARPAIMQAGEGRGRGPRSCGRLAVRRVPVVIPLRAPARGLPTSSPRLDTILCRRGYGIDPSGPLFKNGTHFTGKDRIATAIQTSAVKRARVEGGKFGPMATVAVCNSELTGRSKFRGGACTFTTLQSRMLKAVHDKDVSLKVCNNKTGNRDCTTESFEIENVVIREASEKTHGRKHVLCPVAPSWFETRSEIAFKIDIEKCGTIRVQNWTGDRDDHFEPAKLAVPKFYPRSAAIVDKCSLKIRQQIELRTIPLKDRCYTISLYLLRVAQSDGNRDTGVDTRSCVACQCKDCIATLWTVATSRRAAERARNAFASEKRGLHITRKEQCCPRERIAARRLPAPPCAWAGESNNRGESMEPAQLEEEHCTLARTGHEYLYAKTRLGKVKKAAGIAERRMEGARVCEAELVVGSSHQTVLNLARSAARLSSNGAALVGNAGGKREYPENTCRQAVSSSKIPTCENLGVKPPGIEPGSPWWEASALATVPPRTPLQRSNYQNWTLKERRDVLDRSRFSLRNDSSRKLVWRKPEALLNPRRIVEKGEFGDGIMAWAGIMFDGCTWRYRYCLEEQRQGTATACSHQGETGSIPGGVAPEFSHVGIVPDDTAAR
ncbi:hypothetical protein PR048_017018 [Dryococelus australis]|uniref:Uncharacterized protein n=1 Tax=Dryococelus australis TaxID=614101 RepID=A0ABQ9H8B9_9NEOP|nr:hypothetical protein PR048_017018 [Dryococelus australis]